MDSVDARSVQLVCGGDLMLGRGVNEVIRRFGPAWPLEQLQGLMDGAVFFANLECAISSGQRQYSGPAKGFYFRADPAAVEVLRPAGVRLVSLANNHALDADYEGLRETMKILQKGGIFFVGAGSNASEAAESRVIEVGGVGGVGGLRLGVVGACDHQRDFAATAARAGIRIADPGEVDELAAVERDVAALAEREDIDAVIVTWHWQRNWESAVRAPYRQAARRLADAGATLIWGHSPHHFQGVEWLGRAAVLYSTGDLVDDYATHPTYRNDYQLLFRVSLQKDGRGRARVAAVEAHPIELGYGRTQPAGEEGRRWITDRFRRMCAELGTAVSEQGQWLAVSRPSP